MRILYFSRDYTTHDRRFLLKLSESEHEVCFLRLEDDGLPYEKRPAPDNIRVINWGGGEQPAKTVVDWLRLMPDFEAVLADVQPDLVQAGPVQSCGFMTALAGFRPLLLVSWGSDILMDADQDDLWRWLTGYTLKNADMLLCDSQAVRDKVQKFTPFAAERIVQFPWGIDLQRFAPGPDTLGLRQQPGWRDSFVVLSTRSWEPIYGLEVLLEAFCQAYQQQPCLRLVLLGAGSLSSEIEAYIARHGLEAVIHRPGMVSHMRLPEYFRAVDLYVSCAYSDGSSISLLEAMATGLPVLVTDAPGNREWVVAGQNGGLATAGDAASFAAGLLAAAQLDAADRDWIGRVNRRVAEEKANWDVNFTKLLAAYDACRQWVSKPWPS